MGSEGNNPNETTHISHRLMTTHISTGVIGQTIGAIIRKAIEEGKTFEEVRESIVYNADNPGALDVGTPDGSNDDTLLFNPGNTNSIQEQKVDFKEGRYSTNDDQGYRINGFEHFATDPSKNHANTT